MSYKKLTTTLFTLIALALIAAGCSAGTQTPIDDDGLTVEEEQPIDDDGLTIPAVANTAWELLAIREFDALLAADADNPAVLELKEDGSFHMATGCGELGGTYTLDGDTIAFEVMMTTAVDNCSDTQVEQALAVENLMQNATSYRVEGETLIIAIDGNNDATFELN